MSEKHHIIKTYRDKRITESFDEERDEFLFQKYKHKIEANFLKKVINSVKSDKVKVLDVACGTGRMLPEVFSINKEMNYVGLDSSKEMTKHLIEKAKKFNFKKDIKIKIGDATKMPFKDNEFDIVYSYHLLWHLPKEEQEKIIKEMLRVCKKGGFVVFDVLNENFVWEKAKKYLRKEKTEGIYKWKISEIKKILNNKKIKIEKLSDAPIKDDFIYRIFNIVNHSRKILPLNMFHMLFVSVRK